MIISHEHRFIFIKNRKVGSTSTELALHRICGPDDVLTHDGTTRHMRPARAARAVLWPNARNYNGCNPVPELVRTRSRDLEGGLATALARAGVPDEVAAKATLGRAKTEQRKAATVTFRPETDALIRRAFRREIVHLDFCCAPDPVLFPAGATA